jgi:hypothetical protein
VAQAMHKSLNRLVREYLEQLAGQDQAERDAEEFRRLSGRASLTRAGGSTATRSMIVRSFVDTNVFV